jgi:hypothetical protein
MRLSRLTQLSNDSIKVGLKINFNKTKIIFNEFCTQNVVTVDNHIVEIVNIGKLVNMTGFKEEE